MLRAWDMSGLPTTEGPTAMMTESQIIERPAQPYVALRRTVGIPFGDVVDAALPKLWRWLETHGVEPAGPPFFKYNLIKMPDRLESDFGVPLATPPAVDDEVVTGTLPAGRYATLTFHGPYDKLPAANGALIDWTTEKKLEFDAKSTSEGERFVCRFESYTNDPREVPDPANWETVLYYRLRR
jgi:effector-binding domain-containing protein